MSHHNDGKTGQGNAPDVNASVSKYLAPPMEREITARDQWTQWQAKYPFTLDKVDGFLLALDRLQIRPLDGFIATPECDDYVNTTQFAHITVHGFSDVRMVAEMGTEDDSDYAAPIAATVELEAYHRGFNVWVVVPTSHIARAQMETLIEAIIVEEAK